jgi:hypothetical protein
MFLTDADVREAERPQRVTAGSSMAAVVAVTAVKTVLAAIAGLLLTCGLGLVLWAVTPSSGNGPLPLLRAGIAAFCAANGMTVNIGRSGLTLHPLMLTVVAIALLTTVSGRGRVVAVGPEQEGAAVLTAALAYALAVAGVGAGFAGGTVSAVQGWRPGLLAFVIVGVTTLVRGDGWRILLLDRLPIWVPVSLRCGGAAMVALVGGGAITLVIGLVRTFGDSSTVQTLAAPGAAGGLGMALLGIAFLPNAVVAATGYATGVGFTIGSGTYTPFGSSPTELPAVSLLTAAPDGHAFARPTLLLLLFPLLAGVLIGRSVVRRLDTRNDRLIAAAGSALFTGVLSAAIAGVAGGGVTGGEWSTTGVPPALFGFVVFAALGAVSAATVVLTRVPVIAAGSLGGTAAIDSAVQGDSAQDEDAQDEDVVDEDVVAEAAQDEDVVAEAAQDQAMADDALVDDAAHDPKDTADPVATADPDGPVAPEDSEVNEPDVSVDFDLEGSDSSEEGSEADETAASDVADETADGPPAIPSPRVEDMVAREQKSGADLDAQLASGLNRRAAPRRTG